MAGAPEPVPVDFQDLERMRQEAAVAGPPPEAGTHQMFTPTSEQWEHALKLAYVAVHATGPEHGVDNITITSRASQSVVGREINVTVNYDCSVPGPRVVTLNLEGLPPFHVPLHWLPPEPGLPGR